MSFTYTKSIETDFGGEINTTNLVEEIRSSTITVSLSGVNTDGDVVSIIFSEELATEEVTTLDYIIAHHDPTPTPTEIQPVNVENIPFVTQKPQILGNRVWTFSHDFCDRTTWYTMSTRVVDEAVGTGDGSTTVFSLDNDFVIDVTNGKITDEHLLVPTSTQGGTTYAIEVKVDGVVATEREFGETEGGDYTVNYETGEITFFVAPANGKAITATYFYSPDITGRSKFIVLLSSNLKLLLTDIFVQISKNLVMTDTVETGIFLPDPENPGQDYLYEPSNTRWKKVQDLVNYSDNMAPIIPVFGGTTRGLQNDAMIFYIEYDSPIELSGGISLKFWLRHDRELQGDFASVFCSGVSQEI